MTKKICVLASGGDAPGMNAFVEALYNQCTINGYMLYAAYSGFDGLINERIVLLDRTNATGISHTSGCTIKCARGPQFQTPQGLQKAVAVIRKHGFECMVILGGNGTFAGCARLRDAGIKLFAVPSTIDNDVFVTNNSLGFSSACENAVFLIDTLKATMRTNDRDHVVQLMGRSCPALAQVVGEASFADIIDSNDHRHTPQQIAKIFAEKRKIGVTSCLMVKQEIKAEDVAKEAIDSANFLKEIQIASKNPGIRMNTLGHLQRGATPSARDRWIATNYARTAMAAIKTGRYGTAAALSGDEFIIVEI